MKRFHAALAAVCMLAALTGCAKKEQVSISGPQDLTGKKVGCQAGTTGELFLTEEVEDVDVKSFKTGIDAALSLKNGAIDAVVLDELPAREIVRRNAELTIVTAPFATEEYAIAVRKGESELLSSINKTIATMRADGTHDRLVNCFMPLEGEMTVPEDVPTSGEVIRLGLNAAFPPFEYTEGTRVVGFDISLGQLIARDYGRKLEVVDMNFDGLIAALQSGAIDFIASGMTATDERRKNVDFSDPYYSSTQVIIVRK